MSQSFADQIKAARSANTPLLAIETADNNAAIQRIAAALSDKTPLVQWDVVRGWTPVETVIEGAWVVNQAGVAAMAKCHPGKDLMNPVASLEEALSLLGKQSEPFQPGAILFIHNGHEYLKDPDFAQALFNLRDPFKSNMRTIILLGPAFTLPAQLAQHVTVLDDPLPTTDELATVLKSFGVAGLKLTEDEERRAVEALLGLGTFAAEQSVATSLHVNGSVTLDFDRLWARKRKMIKSTPGLEVWEGGETFGDIGGCDQIKKFARAILNGKRRPEAIVFIDEIEKSMAGSSGSGQDTSGVSQGMLGKMLSEMQDNEYTGMVFVGVPGAAKSAIAKAMGAEGNIPVIVFDLGGMKDSLVGASEARLATALKVVKAVSNGNAMFIATSNNISNLPPELLRRFTLGTWFFDLPSEKERNAIWKIYVERLELQAVAKTAELYDGNWTGAEIKNCCDIASRTNLPLAEAAEFIVPVAVSGAEKIRQLRAQAAGRYLSAAKPGAYQFDEATTPGRVATPVSAGRMIEKEV